jgi:putative PIN family toxin of toxin-antitoxin system
MYKVIIDSNIWVSFLIGKSLRSLVHHIRNEKITIITCEEQLQELTSVFQKPKFLKYFQINQVTTFFTFFRGVSHIVPIRVIKPLCRDSKDDYLLALSIESEAHYLITGDKDLLEIRKIQKTSIINYKDFEAIMNNILTN